MAATKSPTRPGPGPSRPAEAAHRPARVLLVDDKPARLLSYESILAGLPLQCERALSGRDALARLLEQEFAAILLDVDMPEMDGFELARLIRAHPRLESTPIIFITGVNVTELDQLKGYEVGAIDYISVPVVPEILRSKIAILVELYERRAQLQHLNHELESARTRLHQEHQSLSNQQRQLLGIFDHPAHTVWVLQAQRDEAGEVTDFIYHSVNSKALQLLARPPEAVIGRSVREVLGPSGAAAAVSSYAEALRTRELVRHELSIANRQFAVAAWPLDEQCVVASASDVGDLKNLNDALLNVNRRRDEFLAMLAHELRNPLAPIRNAAEVLAHTAQQETQRSMAAIILRQVSQLARLLNDLLEVSRLTQGRIELQLEAVPLTAVTELAIETVQPGITQKQQRLTVSQTVPPPHIYGDKVRLAQALTNLLSNAVTYTQAGGEIGLRTYTDGTDVVIEVTDNGCGIAPDLLPDIFSPFVQGERGLDRSQGGLGVGLSIAKRLIEMHGGHLTAASPGLGAGATFSIRLPRKENGHSSGAIAATAVACSRVLVVDDNRDSADSLARVLAVQGYDTKAVYNAEQALADIAQAPPEVVLLDIGMPGCDGFELARQIKAARPATRIIAVSGYGQSYHGQAQELGFEAHFVKPVDLKTLDDCLRRTEK